MDIPVSDEMDKLDGPAKRVDTQWRVVDVLQIFFPARELRDIDSDNTKQKKILLTFSEFDAREYCVYEVQKYPEQLDSSDTGEDDGQDFQEDAKNENTGMEYSNLQELKNDARCGGREIQECTSTENSELDIDVEPESACIQEEIGMESRDVQENASVENMNLRGNISSESMYVQEGSLEEWDLHEPPEETCSENRSAQEAQGDTSTESMEVQVDTGSESGPLQEVHEDVNSEVGGDDTPFSANSHIDTREEVDLVSLHEHSAGQLCSHEVEWADYWNNWKDTLVNLAWVHRFSRHCKPDFQRWYAEYIHNYPNLLPQISEGLDDFEEELQQTEKEDIDPGADDYEEKKKMDALYESFSVHRETVHKRLYFSQQGWVNISCCGNKGETQKNLAGRCDSEKVAGHTQLESADDFFVQDRKDTVEESDRKKPLEESDKKETVEESGRKEILEESNSSETKGKLVSTRTNSKRTASPTKSGGRRKKSKKSGKSFSVASVIQFLQEVEEAKKDKERLSLKIEEMGPEEVGPLIDCGSNIFSVLNGTMERKNDSHNLELITEDDVKCSDQPSEKLSTSSEGLENIHVNPEGRIMIHSNKESDNNTPKHNYEMALPCVESLNEDSHKLLCTRAEEWKNDSKNVDQNSVELLENREAELAGKEKALVEQTGNHESELVGREESSAEQAEICEVELVGREESSIKQSENYEAEIVGQEETLVEQSEDYEAKLVGMEETPVTDEREGEKQDSEAVVEEDEVHEEVENVEIHGEIQRNCTDELQKAGDVVSRESSSSWIAKTIRSFAQLFISTTLKGFFNAVFIPWQNEEVFAFPGKLSPVSSFVNKIRKWKEKKRIMSKNKNILEKSISRNWLYSNDSKWPQALQNFSVEVQTHKKKRYDKIRWSLGIYKAEEDEGRKVTISMEDVPSREDGVVYFKKEKSYMTSTKEPPADFPLALHKYWNQRHRLFYKFDEGVRLDHESWYSATPECIAVHHALRCACSIVVDAFCGAGGNAIQFAFSCSHVIAIDIDEAKIEIARHNAQVYGVADRIEFIVGDFFQLAPTLKADVVFLSPPWGGPEYLCSPVYDLAHLSGEITASRLMEAAQKISSNIAIFLPKNTDVKQLLCMGSKMNKKISIEKNKIGHKVKALTVYFGEIAEYWEEDM